MRVSDGEIMQLGEHCADDTIGDLEARPTPYLQTCFEEDEPAFDAPREMYRKAWCSDNAKACTQHADANADACGDYTMVCGTDDTRADAGATETAPDAGATETAPDAGDDTDQAHIDGRNPRSGDDHTSGSCAVQPARAGSNMLAGWIALAAAWLMRRREQR
jgi:MYXO-CTERM domain-containing protein